MEMVQSWVKAKGRIYRFWLFLPLTYGREREVTRRRKYPPISYQQQDGHYCLDSTRPNGQVEAPQVPQR